MVFGLFSIHWVMQHRVIEMFDCWPGKFSQHQNFALWRFLPHCLCWCIWWEPNARCFEDCERSILGIKSLFFLTLLEWSLALPLFSCISLPVLINYCNLGS